MTAYNVMVVAVFSSCLLVLATAIYAIWIAIRESDDEESLYLRKQKWENDKNE